LKVFFYPKKAVICAADPFSIWFAFMASSLFLAAWQSRNKIVEFVLRPLHKEKKTNSGPTEFMKTVESEYD